MTAIAAFVGRLFLAVLFIHSGINKLLAPDATGQMLAGAGLSPNLAVPTGIFEVLAGAALVLGFMTRLAALLLAGFCLLAALMFHNQISDPMQLIQAEKNLAIAGGLLALFAVSQMRWSYDAMRLRRRGELATAKAEERAHEAELRAAAAEGRAAVLPHAAGAPGAAAVVPPARRKWFWSR